MKITVETTVKAPIKDVWRAWTTPDDIVKWNAASDDWHTTDATVDLRIGGPFCSRMEAKDGSFGFDFDAIYVSITEGKEFTYEFGGREARVSFNNLDGKTQVTIVFDAESENPIEMQKNGWQAILENFRKHVESNS